VSEAPLESLGKDARQEQAGRARENGRDVVAEVTDGAIGAAGRRGGSTFSTSDVLLGVMEVYGADFDDVLRVHGTDRDEVLGRLGVTMPGPGGA
jgi:hypothetical protein